MLKTLYFDLGNVLLFFSLDKMKGQISALSGLSQQQIESLFFQTDLRKQFETGRISSAELYQAFLHLSPKAFSQEAFNCAFCNIFTPNLELWNLVSALKQKKVRLILLSNTSDLHYQFAKAHYPILELFDHTVLSYEVGAWKPDDPIFQHALELSHCAPNECFYTDDIPEFIEAARKNGLNGEVFTSVSHLAQVLTLQGCPLL